MSERSINIKREVERKIHGLLVLDDLRPAIESWMTDCDLAWIAPDGSLLRKDEEYSCDTIDIIWLNVSRNLRDFLGKIYKPCIFLEYEQLRDFFSRGIDAILEKGGFPVMIDDKLPRHHPFWEEAHLDLNRLVRPDGTPLGLAPRENSDPLELQLDRIVQEIGEKNNSVWLVDDVVGPEAGTIFFVIQELQKRGVNVDGILAAVVCQPGLEKLQKKYPSLKVDNFRLKKEPEIFALNLVDLFDCIPGAGLTVWEEGIPPPICRRESVIQINDLHGWPNGPKFTGWRVYSTGRRCWCTAQCICSIDSPVDFYEDRP